MFQAYHGVTGAQHQTRFNSLSAQGFRMISLSVYGDPGDPRYVAVWVQRPGPGWVAVHGVDSAGYQSFFNNSTAKGYVPVLVSATGTSSNAIFAAVFEQGLAGAWRARHGMTSGPEATAGTLQNLNKTAKDQKMILRSVAIYGTASDRCYAAVWHANPQFVKWHVHPSDTSASYQVVFNAETQLPGYQLASYRPAYVALSGDQIYCSVFKDDVVGGWVARHGMTAADYQTEFNTQTAAGLHPICVQGGGSGGNTRYSAIFAKQDIPLNREWTVTGTAVPALAGFDHAMQTFMQVNGVRAAQLAIAKNGVTKFSRAYTWAESGYRITQPSDRFLLASCSKMFLEAAVQALYDAKKLTSTTKVYPLLGFSGPLDPRSDTITIQQLLDHMGGYDDTATGSGFDPTYSMRKIAIDLGLGHPVTKLDMASYMYHKYMLDFAPGTNNKYSNFGYLLASAVVEKVTGMKYFDYVNTTFLQPANISEVLVFPTLASNRTNNMAIIEDQALAKSAIDLNSQLLVPWVYGGGGEINEVGEACAGTGASAHAMTQFIHLHAVWGNGPRAAGYARAGSTPGSSSLAVSRGDGIDWAYVVNTRNWPPSTSPTLEQLGNSITQLLDTTPIT
jgi:CubicO group peptidase (beta-lactamase class C family)